MEAVIKGCGAPREVKRPSHTCDICHGEFPCWEKDCPIAERFVCDDCADDALDETGSAATR